MDRHFAEWKLELDRIWSAQPADYGAAARLAQLLASTSEDEALRRAASQAVPILRCAAQDGADHATCVAARRRLAVVREVFYDRTTPQFGRRRAGPQMLTVEERSRELLGLPFDCRLSEVEIHRAYKLLAKRTHPDAGGSEEAFLRITAAHDALMRERRAPPRR